MKRTRQVSVRLEEELYQKVCRLAQRESRTVSGQIRQLLRVYFRTREDQQAPTLR